MQSGTK
ncbi:hypothetical protein A2U01_0112652, partial [Trifolium medium]|nr:hypothetical protein [Trifolium medium]